MSNKNKSEQAADEEKKISETLSLSLSNVSDNKSIEAIVVALSTRTSWRKL